MNRRTLPLSDHMVELVARRFRMLGEPFRLRILQLLEEGERSVGEVTDALGATQSNISKQLQALHDAGLLSRRREGNCIYYSIADPVVFKLCELVCKGAEEDARAKLSAIAGSVRAKRARE